MNILHFVADGYNEYNSSNFRVAIPATAIHMSGKANVRIMGIREWVAQSQRGVSACSWSDIIVLQRVLVDESIDHVASWVGKGKKVVVDFDDAYDLIREDNAAYKFWGEGLIDIRLNDGTMYERPLEEHPVAQFKRGLEVVSGITTPSRVLCADWERYTNAFYLPNYLDLPRYDKYKKRHNRMTTIAWGGSLSHVPSFEKSGVAAGLRKALINHGEARFLLVGDERISKKIKIPQKQFAFAPYVKANDWPAVLRRYDIGLAPLYGEYDCRRSHLKVMEYLALGIPFVATESAVYQDFFEADSGIFIDQGELTKCDQQNDRDWFRALRAALNHHEDMVACAQDNIEPYRHIYDVSENVDNIIKVYEDILNS